MKHYFFLAGRFLAYHRMCTLILVASIGLTVYLPLTVQWLVTQFEEQMLARARETPLVAGAPGSRFDLTFHTLYYRAAPPATIRLKDQIDLRDTGLATTIPIFARYSARGFPIVGTSLEYFDYRGLNVAEGRSWSLLGDCVVGHRTARKLGLRPGDRLLSDPENVFDLGGMYPLNMLVAGILEPTQSADDEAVFVDVKTAWVIEGLAHGHQELNADRDPAVVLRSSDTNIVANAALVHYTEITPQNIASFHFHAQPEALPLSAVIVLPHHAKSATLLLGRFQAGDSTLQVVEPVQVVEEMMSMVFRVKRFFELHSGLVAVATCLFLVLIISLSLRLRQGEMEIVFHLGGSRFTLFWLQTTELILVVGMSLITATLLSLVTLALAEVWLAKWILT